MPDTQYTPPAFTLQDTDVVSILKETLARAILTRQNIVLKPKPTYDIDGQKFSWTEYLAQLDKTIAQLNNEIQSADGPFEIESSIYT